MTVSFKTFGCRLNRAETDSRMNALLRLGFDVVPFGEASEVTVLHSCAVTHAAEAECVRMAGAVKRRNPGTFLVFSGCAAKARSEECFRELGVDMVLRPGGEDTLAEELLRRFADKIHSAPGRAAEGVGLHRALLKVQDGCSNFCSYCFVPIARSLPRSRKMASCLEEARRLIDVGYSEIVVVGCNLSFYEDGNARLPDLLAALTALPGDFRVRLSSLEPGRFEREIAALMASEKKLCPFLHLPLQSGDDEVLKRMGRRYDANYLQEMLSDVCARLPLFGLGADVIAGFPGERPEQFERTYKLVESFPFSNLHVFPYSKRPGTPAAEFPDQISPEDKKLRAGRLIALRDEKKAEFAARHRGHEVEVLIERIDADGTGHGWSADYLQCECPGCSDGDLGKIVKCRFNGR